MPRIHQDFGHVCFEKRTKKDKHIFCVKVDFSSGESLTGTGVSLSSSSVQREKFLVLAPPSMLGGKLGGREEGGGRGTNKGRVELLPHSNSPPPPL